MTLPFNGGGRWAFNTNIENLDRWIRDDVGKTPGLEAAYRLWEWPSRVESDIIKA